MNIPFVTVNQMIEVDRLMINDFSIDLLQMMENAGRLLAKVAINEFKPKKVTILIGKGNNGGGGLICARYLYNKGIDVEIILATEELGKISIHHLKTIKSIGIKIVNKIDHKIDLIIDSLLGYNAKGEPKGGIAKFVKEANSIEKPILSLDVPTGFDMKTGKYFKNSFRNATVLTLGLPKQYMQNNIKNLFIGDIGIPINVYKKVGINNFSIFNKDDIVKI